jgi:hypothetical protein
MKKVIYWNYILLVYFCLLADFYFLYNGYIDSQHSDKDIVLYFIAIIFVLLNFFNINLLRRYRIQKSEKYYLFGILISTILLGFYINVFFEILGKFINNGKNNIVRMDVQLILPFISPLIIVYNLVIFCWSKLTSHAGASV